MKVKKTITILSTGALAVATLLGVIGYRNASAQSSTPTAPTTTAPSSATPGLQAPGKPGFDRGMRGGVSNEGLATALGATVDQLNTAYQTANSAAIDQALAEGLITQAQADQMKANSAGFPMGGRGGGWLAQSGVDYNALLAKALGISVEQLQAARAQAFNTQVDQAVTDGTLTQDQANLMKGQYALNNSQTFQSALQSAYQAAVQQAVTSGVITQAQADLIVNNNNGIGFPGMHGMGDFGRGPGGPGGQGGSAPVAPPSSQPTTPSSGTGTNDT